MINEFDGSVSTSIDAKGRAVVPAAYREILGEHFTLGLNNEFNAMALYPTEIWNDKSEKLKRIPDSDVRGMRYVRLIKAFSYPNQQLDGQGRLLLPATLRQRVGVTKDICFVGVGRCLEIWDEARFDAQYGLSAEDVSSLSDYVNERYFNE